MNTEYKSKEDKLIVTDEYGYKTQRNITNNFKEILITENNIEEIENFLIKNNDDKKNNIKEIKRDCPHWIIIASSWLISSILFFINGDYVLGCIYFGVSNIWLYNGLSGIMPNIKGLRANKKSTIILEKQLTEEKNNLKELKKEDKNDLNFLNQISGTISTSEKIQDLKHKLIIIHLYEMHKTKLIRLYKRGKLENSYFGLFYGDDFKIVEELIKNDLQNKNTPKRENQKVLKIKK